MEYVNNNTSPTHSSRSPLGRAARVSTEILVDVDIDLATLLATHTSRGSYVDAVVLFGEVIYVGLGKGWRHRVSERKAS